MVLRVRLDCLHSTISSPPFVNTTTTAFPAHLGVQLVGFDEILCGERGVGFCFKCDGLSTNEKGRGKRFRRRLPGRSGDVRLT